MAADPTLDLDLAATVAESRRLAAYQLATAGIKVPVLEAGRMIDHRKEYRTMASPGAPWTG